MKRTEMVDKLNRFIIEKFAHQLSDDMLYESEDVALFILNFLEGEGMKPPEVKNYTSSGNLWNISSYWEDE